MFKKGNIPWNKNTKGIMKAWNKGLKTGYAPWLGKKRSEETRRKISEIQKGKKRPLTELGKIIKKEQMKKRWQNLEFRKMMSERMKNFRHSDITKQKIRNGKIGSKNPNWKEGVSFEPYPTLFNQQLKDRIRVRDNFICQKCGVPELEYYKRLDIHHIDYDKNNCQEDNLISLCSVCNTKANKDREYWKNYFKDLIMKKLGGYFVNTSLNM